MFGLSVFQFILSLAILLCTLATGFVLMFAIVVMPGISGMADKEYLNAFQKIDGIIQNFQPVFMGIWLSSALAAMTVIVLAFLQLDGLARGLAMCAAGIYLLGVQLPTFMVNIPLNNRVHGLDIESLDQQAAQLERQNFEGPWNRWNNIRSALGVVSATLMIYLLAVL
ncbi:MAG: DUF1772 domain-containing protein [Chloroflexota bacterium]